MRRGVLLVGGPCDGQTIWAEPGQFEYKVTQVDVDLTIRNMPIAKDDDPIPLIHTVYRPKPGGSEFRWYATT